MAVCVDLPKPIGGTFQKILQAVARLIGMLQGRVLFRHVAQGGNDQRSAGHSARNQTEIGVVGLAGRQGRQPFDMLRAAAIQGRYRGTQRRQHIGIGVAFLEGSAPIVEQVPDLLIGKQQFGGGIEYRQRWKRQIEQIAQIGVNGVTNRMPKPFGRRFKARPDMMGLERRNTFAG